MTLEEKRKEIDLDFMLFCIQPDDYIGKIKKHLKEYPEIAEPLRDDLLERIQQNELINKLSQEDG